MRAILVLLLVSGCAGKPAPMSVVANKPATPMAHEARRGQESEAFPASEPSGAGDEVYTSCGDAVRDSAVYSPIIDDTTIEREWTTQARSAAIAQECYRGWNEYEKACFASASSRAEVARCVSALEASRRASLETRIAEVDTFANKISSARTKPASISCSNVVAQHYGDARWKGKLDGIPATERKRMIAESRALMTKACAAEKWDESFRACFVIGANDTCLEATGSVMEWGFPAVGVAVKIGVPECDAYADMFEKLGACAAMHPGLRDSLQLSIRIAQASWASGRERASLAPTCKLNLEQVQRALREACP